VFRDVNFAGANSMTNFLKYGWWVAFISAIWVCLSVTEHMVFWRRAIGLAATSGAFVLLERTIKKRNLGERSPALSHHDKLLTVVTRPLHQLAPFVRQNRGQ
jgi:hypothetical protein